MKDDLKHHIVWAVVVIVGLVSLVCLFTIPWTHSNRMDAVKAPQLAETERRLMTDSLRVCQYVEQPDSCIEEMRDFFKTREESRQ